MAHTLVITPEQFLAAWQGHRTLTRRTIAAFPDDKLFSYSVGGMRPFSDLANEMLSMAVPTLKGVVTGTWTKFEDAKAATKEEILARWDKDTGTINTLFAQIPAARWQEVDTAFGQWKMPIYDLMNYVVDNEIHHRGQGYVFLRALGIEPPPFYER